MLRRRRTSGDTPGPGDVYAGLRNQIFALDPHSVGLQQTSDALSAWACVMDTGFPNGTATLVCLSDGTTSLYTSSGFGVIGGGGHEVVRGENATLLAVLDRHLAAMTPSADASLPGEGRTIIRALTWDGQRIFEADENELGQGRSELSEVFLAAHAVISQLRLIEESDH